MTATTNFKATSLSQHPSGRHHHQRDYSPVSWTEYFDEAHDIVIGGHNGSSTLHNKPTTSVESQAATLEETATDQITKEVTTTDQQQTNPAEDSFRVYLRNFHKPYAPDRTPGTQLDPTKVEISEAELTNYSKVPTLVALHGGGYSGLSWAQFTRHIEQQCKCRVLAMDLRGHGDTKTSHDDKMDIDTLVLDVVAVVDATHQLCGFPQTPKIVLIGHSMGGAIAVKCSTKCSESLPSLAGFVIIDVVEGTAKDALPQMMSVIKTRPTKFPSLANAIEWSVRSGMAKNSDAARVSMPGNLVSLADSHLSIHDVPAKQEDDKLRSNIVNKIKRHKFSISIDQLIGQRLPSVLLPRACPLPPRIGELKGSFGLPMPTIETPVTGSSATAVISEEQEGEASEVPPTSAESGKCSLDSSRLTQTSRPPKRPSEDSTDDTNGYKRPPEVDSSGYGWRTNLARTQPHWNGWFDGLSTQLLDAPVQGKFLLLAGIDRLDKALTIGHMQGKFMMKVLPKCGHAVHEDVPEQVALAIGDFLVRNKFTVASDTQSED